MICEACKTNYLGYSTCPRCAGWQRERRDAWVRFAAYGSTIRWSMATEDSPIKLEEVSCGLADLMLAEFDERFGPKEGT